MKHNYYHWLNIIMILTWLDLGWIFLIIIFEAHFSNCGTICHRCSFIVILLMWNFFPSTFWGKLFLAFTTPSPSFLVVVFGSLLFRVKVRCHDFSLENDIKWRWQLFKPSFIGLFINLFLYFSIYSFVHSFISVCLKEI